MTTKKVKHTKSTAAKKGSYFVYHGIKIAEPGRPASRTAEIIQEELLKRSELRGARKSA